MLSNVNITQNKQNEINWPLKNFSVENLSPCYTVYWYKVSSNSDGQSVALSTPFGGSYLWDTFSTHLEYFHGLQEWVDVVLLIKYQNNKSTFHLHLLVFCFPTLVFLTLHLPCSKEKFYFLCLGVCFSVSFAS